MQHFIFEILSLRVLFKMYRQQKIYLLPLTDLHLVAQLLFGSAGNFLLVAFILQVDYCYTNCISHIIDLYYVLLCSL